MYIILPCPFTSHPICSMRGHQIQSSIFSIASAFCIFSFSVKSFSQKFLCFSFLNSLILGSLSFSLCAKGKARFSLNFPVRFYILEFLTLISKPAFEVVDLFLQQQAIQQYFSLYMPRISGEKQCQSIDYRLIEYIQQSVRSKIQGSNLSFPSFHFPS